MVTRQYVLTSAMVVQHILVDVSTFLDSGALAVLPCTTRDVVRTPCLPPSGEVGFGGWINGHHREVAKYLSINQPTYL